jgi:hypothetical protein
VRGLAVTRQIRTDPNTWHERYWRRSDIDELKRLIDEGYSYTLIARRLGRSREAVKIKAERINYRMMHTKNAISARDAQALLGLACSKTVIRWITGYGLKARNGGTKERPLWRIQWLDLMEWLEAPEHWMAYDPAKVSERTLREHLTEIRQGQPRWLTAGEVARRLCVTESAVATYRAGGLLPMVRYGNWWARESDVIGFVIPSERPRVQRAAQEAA